MHEREYQCVKNKLSSCARFIIPDIINIILSYIDKFKIIFKNKWIIMNRIIVLISHEYEYIKHENLW
jgi:hypothetical protein